MRVHVRNAGVALFAAMAVGLSAASAGAEVGSVDDGAPRSKNPQAASATQGSLTLAEVMTASNALGISSEVDITTANAFAKADNVTVEAATIDLLLEGQAEVLSAWLRQRYADRFASVEYNHHPFRVVVRLKKATIADLRGAPIQSLSGRVDLYEAKFSETEMLTAGRLLSDELQNSRVDAGMSIKTNEDRFEVTVTDASSKQHALDAAARFSGAEVTSPVVDIKIGQTDPLAARIHGGLLFNGTGGDCTTGFTAVRPDGVRVIYTAAHCSDSARIVYGQETVPMVLDVSRNGGREDIQQMYSTACCIQAPNWVNDGQTYTGDPTPYYRVIYSQKSQIEDYDSSVEKWGRTTGYTTGRVRDVFYQPRSVVPPGAEPRTGLYVRTTMPGAGGDSGGPVMLGSQAYGLVHATYGEPNPTAPVIYMPLRNSTLTSRVATN